MLYRRLSFWIKGALLTAILGLTALCAAAQDQKLPDAPAPQNNAPAPNVTVPPPNGGDEQTSPSTNDNPNQSANTRDPQPPNPQPPPPGSEEIKTVPQGGAPGGGESGRDELMTLTKTVSFVAVPVTVKDDEGK